MADRKKASAKKLSRKTMKKTKGGALGFSALGYGGSSVKAKVIPYNELGYGGGSALQSPQI